MGNLAFDTELTPVGPGCYQTTLSRDWQIWGPNGGYLAALVLRAAGAHSGLARPASIACQFVRVGAFKPAEVHVQTIARSRRAESLLISVKQDDGPIIQAQVWAVSESLDGPTRQWLDLPVVKPPQETEVLKFPSFEQIPYFRNLEIRAEAPELGVDREARIAGWCRLKPQATFSDPWLDAGRMVIFLDQAQFPAVSTSFAKPDFVAPSLDLYAAFHGLEPDSEWLFSEAIGTAAADGLIAGRANVWSPQGRLLASGTQQMLCRRFENRQ